MSFLKSFGALHVPEPARSAHDTLRRAAGALAERWMAAAAGLRPHDGRNPHGDAEVHADGVAGGLEDAANELLALLGDPRGDNPTPGFVLVGQNVRIHTDNPLTAGWHHGTVIEAEDGTPVIETDPPPHNCLCGARGDNVAGWHTPDECSWTINGNTITARPSAREGR